MTVLSVPDLAEMANDSISDAEVMIRSMMERGIVHRKHLYVIVGMRDLPLDPMLATRTFGDQAEWEHDYARIAEGKFSISMQTGLSSREVQLMRPDLLVDRNVKFWGSIVYSNIIVACSGVKPWFDEAFSNAIAGLFFARIYGYRSEQREDDSTDFYGGY